MMIPKKREPDFLCCQSALVADGAFVKNVDVRIRLMAEHIYKPGILIRDVFFEGGDVLRCYRGSFRFSLDGFAPITIGEGEAIVVYPGQRVTIEALEKVNLLVYVILEGTDVAPYFDRLGFFNGLHGKTTTQIEVFRNVKHRFETDGTVQSCELVNQLSDALVTYAHDFRENGNALLFSAIRQIRINLKNRIVRLGPLCEQLKVSHTYLHRIFVRSGIGSPSDFVRREQLCIVMRQLRENEIPIAEIAEDAGFISATHFANFVKHYTGMTAREIRRGL